MTAKRDVKWRRASELAATRRTIQHEYLRMLNEADFSFRAGDKEPYGLQRKVMRSVNQQFYGPTRMKTNPQQVSDWVRRVRENNYEVTSCEQDYSESSQNSRVFFDAEQQRIRDFIREPSVCVFYFLWNLVTLKIGENKIGVCRVAVAGIGCCGLWVEPPLEYRTAPLQVAWPMKNAL